MADGGVDVSRFTLRDDLPVHRQVAAYFKTMIALGHLAPGGELPPLNALASRFGVAQAEMRRAFAELASRGILSGRGARWSVAKGDVESDFTDQLRDLLAEGRRSGLSPARLRALVDRAFREGANELTRPER